MYIHVRACCHHGVQAVCVIWDLGLRCMNPHHLKLGRYQALTLLPHCASTRMNYVQEWRDSSLLLRSYDNYFHFQTCWNGMQYS